MQSVQTVGIDLPLKALVWEDASRTTSFVQRTELDRAEAPHPERGTGRE
jgi:uncharacterized protein (DUF302 family)